MHTKSVCCDKDSGVQGNKINEVACFLLSASRAHNPREGLVEKSLKVYKTEYKFITFIYFRLNMTFGSIFIITINVKI